MKKIKLLYLFSLPLFSVYAQTITIRDKSTRETLQQVIIQDKNNVQVKTNDKGKADISTLNKQDSLLIYQFGYMPLKVLMANESAETTIDLSAKTVNLNEIVLSANRKEESKIDVPYAIEVIKQKDIEFVNPANSGDMLLNTGVVFQQKSQAGGGSPVMRGFEASRVLIVVDGVRMNNAIYRAGHLQDVMTIDPNMLDRTEVLFGPSSTIYGSDALGGVMHFYTKNAQHSHDDRMIVKTNAMARYSSAAQEKTGHLDFNLGWRKFASLTNITYSDFGDLMSGATKLTGYSNTWDRAFYQDRINNRDTMLRNSNTNLQKNSGYNQVDIMQRFSLKTGNHLTHNLNLQYSSSSYIPRYDRLNGNYSGGKFSFAENGYDPQKRTLGAYTLTYKKRNMLTDNVKVILAYQKIDQDRVSRRWQKTARIIQREDVTVLSANVDAFKLIKQKHELRYGSEFTYNDVQSKADSVNIINNTEGIAQTRYPDGGSKMSSFAVYASHSWNVNKNFVITDGIRYTNTSLSFKLKDTSYKATRLPYNDGSQKNQAVTGSLGFIFKNDDDYKVTLLTNTGYRSPNIDDLTKIFDAPSGKVVVPNPDVKPEYTYNFELGISKVINNKYKFDVTVFHTTLNNVLVLKDFTFNGQDSATYQGVKSKVQALQNADKSYIYGFTGGVQFDFNENLSFKSVINYTHGRYVNSKLDSVIPLDHIAPIFGQTSLIAKAKSVEGEFFVRYNGKKSLGDYSPSGEDNLNYATSNGMPAWFTLNIRAGLNFTKNLRLNVACENITDNCYRVFASGINAAGRNVIVSLRYKL